MKKFLTLLPAVALAMAACSSSKDDSSENSPVTPPGPAKDLSKDYIVTDMGDFAYTNGAFDVTKATCSSKANNYLWEKTTRHGSLMANSDGTINVDFGDGEGVDLYQFTLEGTFPNGIYYQSSTLEKPLVLGFILDDSYYDEVAFVNTECIFQNFREMQETFADGIANSPLENVDVKCNELSVGGLQMTYEAHTDSSIDYKLSYNGKYCRLHHKFLYAYSENDCKLAFQNYQAEYDNGETKDLFDFNDYDQAIVNNEGDGVDETSCDELLIAYNNRAVLAKQSVISGTQIKNIIRAVGSSIRRHK